MPIVISIIVFLPYLIISEKESLQMVHRTDFSSGELTDFKNFIFSSFNKFVRNTFKDEK